MTKGFQIGLMAAVILIAGCGYNRIGAPLPKKTKPVVNKTVETSAVAMKDAFGKARAFAQANYGDDFRPVMAFGTQVFALDGAMQPGTWQFNMVGHKRGEAGYTYVKIKVGTDGAAYVDPKTGGPFPDKNEQHKLPNLDLDGAIDPVQGMAIVMTEGHGKKFPPSYPVSWEVRPSDRLKQTVMRYSWAHVAHGGVKWWVDTSLNPMTGEVVEKDASHE